MMTAVLATQQRTPSSSPGLRKVATVQVGAGGKVNDLHVRAEKDLNLGPFFTHLTARFRPSEENMLHSLQLSGFLGDVTYQATRALADTATDVQLGLSLPSGVQLAADVKAEGSNMEVEKVSAFHRAGPFNIEPAWLRATRTLRLTLGRGGNWHRCPFSLQTDLKPDGSKDYELGVRHEFEEGRKLRARLMLPGEAEARAIWAEYQDSKIENGRGVWYAKASMPLGDEASSDGGLLDKAEFSLRRAWSW